MKAEIISCGTELLLGEVIDTNKSYLARELASIGVSVYHHTTVGDNPNRLLKAIKHAESRANLIIISGGLGPTQDDITKDILAKHLNLDLIIDKVSLEKTQNRYNTKDISEANYHQSLVIKSAEVIKNDIGMAAGMFIEKNNRDYVLLPGPPKELEDMVSKHLIPILLNRTADEEKLESRNLNFYGLPEATIAQKLEDIIETQTNPTIAIYAKEGIIDIRLTVAGKNNEENKKLLDQTEAEILKRIGKYFISYDKKTMQDVIREYLNSNKQNIAVIEVNTTSHVQDIRNEKMMVKNPVKTSFYFSKMEDAQRYFELDSAGEENKGIAELNKKLALAMKNQMKTNYALAVSSYGEVNEKEVFIPEKLYMTLVNDQGEKVSKKLDFDSKMYLADWVIKLKTSDFIRRYLLSLEQLED